MAEGTMQLIGQFAGMLSFDSNELLRTFSEFGTRFGCNDFSATDKDEIVAELFYFAEDMRRDKDSRAGILEVKYDAIKFSLG